MKRSSFLVTTALTLAGLAVVMQGSAALRSEGSQPATPAADSKSAVVSVDAIEVEMQASQQGLVVVRETVIPADSEGAVQCQAVTTLALAATNGRWTVTKSHSRVDRKSCRLVG